MKNKYTIVIPVHQYNDEVNKYLERCLKSIVNQKKINYKPTTLIVATSNIADDIRHSISNMSLDLDFEVLINNGNTSFQSQMNFACLYVKTKYFMFLEYDDELTDTYLNVFDNYYDEVSDNALILNLILNRDVENKPLYISNTMAWSKQFTDKKLGHIELNGLEEFSDFRLSGAFFDTKVFKSIGMLKNNIKLSFNYEYMLRLVNSGHSIYVIPKIGYKHTENRDGSLFAEYMIYMPITERAFWFETAKKEYFFNVDRVIKMEK